MSAIHTRTLGVYVWNHQVMLKDPDVVWEACKPKILWGGDAIAQC